MLERIKHILQNRQLTPTQFADVIGVARPIISHILSGRNKPSLEVVQKIIAAFPDLSLPWLLSGTEPMLAVSAAAVGPLVAQAATMAAADAAVPPAPTKPSKSVVAATPTPAEPVAPSIEGTAVPLEPVKEVAPVVPAAPALAFPASVAEASAAMPPAHTPAPIAASVALPVSPPASPLAAFLEPGKKIKRIVIFYQDGTFGDYQPEQ